MLTPRALAGRAVSRLADTVGHDLVRRHFYSPLPDLTGLPESLWTTPRALIGVDLRVDDAIEFMQTTLKPYLAEFDPPHDPSEAATGFFIDNSYYGSVDAEVLYAIVRHAKPGRVVELGSGASSHVIALARVANAADGAAFEHEIYDPFPFAAGRMGPVTGARVQRVRAEEIDCGALAELLTADDILFVDTTHTVKTGGDVDRIFLDLVPRLRPGVWVHVHDIFLPYEYPRYWVVDERRVWAEQYLLQAFLAFNDAFRVEFPAHAVAGTAPQALSEAVRSFRPGLTPGSFWMRRV